MFVAVFVLKADGSSARLFTPWGRHPGWWGLTWQPVPLPPANTRPVFQRSATIGGLSITSPSDWVLVDYLGLWNSDAVPLDNTAVPVLELTNFDPGLSTPVCDTAPGGSTRLPADGVAIFAMVGNGSGTVDDACGRNIAGFHHRDAQLRDRVPYRFVLAMGPNVTERDQANADESGARSRGPRPSPRMRGAAPRSTSWMVPRTASTGGSWKRVLRQESVQLSENDLELERKRSERVRPTPACPPANHLREAEAWFGMSTRARPR